MSNLISFYLNGNNLGYAIFSQNKLAKCGKFVIETTDDVNNLLDLIIEYEPKISVLNNINQNKEELTILNIVKHLLFVFQINLYEVSLKNCLSEIEKNVSNIFISKNKLDIKRYIEYYYNVIPLSDEIMKAIILGHYIINKFSKNNTQKKEVL